MALNPLDIRNFFEEMELNLIANLIRNIFHHKDEEKKEGFNWRAWQAEALKNIDIFRRQNAKDVNAKRPAIDESTKEYLDEQYSEGSGNRERLKFFRFNSDRYDALASEAQTVNENIYSSTLRNVDDVYRQVVAKRRLNMRSGGISLRQAIDSATEDFLDRGITSIQYRDGRRVNIASYREMALRTAGSRAQFIADGQLREMMGRDLVLISQYGACSKTCLPWQGRVYIDDVFQEYHGEKLDGGKNGISRNGKKYTLLSYAMAGGLFHPNCRHTMVDYIEGITEIPPRLDTKTVRRNSELEQEQRAKEREIRRLKRYVTGTLDPDKRKEYGLQLDAAQKDLEKYIKKNSDVLRRDPWREQMRVPNFNPEKESQHKWKYRDTLIDRDYIESNEYRRKYDKLGESEEITRLIYQSAKEILNHRSGSKYEDLYFIDSESGKIIKQNQYTVEESTVSPTKRMINMLKGRENRIISIHNHPENSIPSADDLYLAGERKYKYGIVVCHNGDIFIYRNNTDLTLNYFRIKLAKAYENSYNQDEVFAEAMTSMLGDSSEIWGKKL